MLDFLNANLAEWLRLYGGAGEIFCLVYAFIIGACFGSFITACVWRIPRGISILWPPSRCPKCGHRITAMENIPMLSWLLLRGKCSGCGLPISAKYFRTELLTALLFTLTAAKFIYRTPWAPLGVIPVWILIVLSVASARTDLEKLVIPDKFTYPAMILALVCAWALPGVSALPGGMPLRTLCCSIASGAAMTAFGAGVVIAGRILFKRDAFGWGDVKFLIAAAMFLGVFGTMAVIVAACVLSLLWLGLDRIRRGRFRRYFPFGPFLAAGTVLWLLLVNVLGGEMSFVF